MDTQLYLPSSFYCFPHLEWVVNSHLSADKSARDINIQTRAFRTTVLQPCDLWCSENGKWSVKVYCPHLAARQLGFVQVVPAPILYSLNYGNVSRAFLNPSDVNFLDVICATHVSYWERLDLRGYYFGSQVEKTLKHHMNQCTIDFII